jgi:hypothetical protein
VYHLSKCSPDILIQNVILGTKHIYWHGNLSIKCESTGYSADLVLEAAKAQNPVKGAVRLNNEDVGMISGVTGHPIYFSDDAKGTNKRFLCDAGKMTPAPMEYPLMEDLPSNSSIKLWSEVTQAIIANDLELAEVKKCAIEEAERIRRKEEEKHEPAYFREVSENVWQVKNPCWYETSPDINKNARLPASEEASR